MTDWLDARMEDRRPGLLGWLRVALRGTALALVIYGGLVLLLLVRLVERPLCGAHRPVTPWITQGACRAALLILGLRFRVHGRPMQEPGAVVANHGSWLDIFTLNACQRVYFVSKSEVSAWPGIGWLAKATGTLFINRRGREAKAQQRLFEERLAEGHRILFFPEGTSTDATRILPFKSTLFAAFFAPGQARGLAIQPVTVIYRAPEGEDPRFYGWWGDMDFAPHLLKLLAAPRQGSVEVRFNEPLPVEAFADRKALAQACETMVRAGFY